MDKIICEESVNIRIMTLADLEEVISLESLVFGTHPDIDSYKKACINSGNIYMVAENDVEIMAYCTVVTSYETADLCNIAVKEEYRRNHVAHMLLSECILHCITMGVERILLEVREDNVTALKFYRKMNFKEIGKRIKYYTNPFADAIIMEKSLQQQ